MNHRLLLRQIRRHEGLPLDDPRFQAFLEAVDQAYHHADREQALLANALDHTSRELGELNERTRRENADFLRRIMDTLATGVYATDDAGRVTMINRSGAEMLGYTPEELLGTSLHEVAHHHHPDGRPYPMEECPFSESYRVGSSREGREWLIHRDGRSIPVSFMTAPLTQGDVITGSVGSYRDMLEVDHMAAALEAKERQYRTVVDHLRDVVFQTDRDGAWTFLNPAWELVTGFTVEESLCRPSESYLLAEDLPVHRQAMAALLARTQEFVRYEIRCRTAGGRLRWIQVVVRLILDGEEHVGAAGTLTDIHESHEAREQLMLQRAALDAAANMVVITDAHGTIQYVNRAFTQNTGYSAAEARGADARLLKSGEQEREFYRELWTTVLAGKVWEGEMINRRKDGSLYPEEQSITPLMDEHGRISHFVAIKRDITERKHAEAELSRARDRAVAANRLKSEFLSTMSHELRTPMNGILGMADLLLDTPLDSEQGEWLGILRDSANSLLTILNDILDFSKIEAGKLQVELTDHAPLEVVEGVVDLLAARAREKGIALHSFVAPRIPAAVTGDPHRVRQVLVNLVGNAVKFTEHGEVVVRATVVREDAAQVVVRYEVTDTGIGISPEAQERLFMPFVQADGSTTRKYGGTGLGLSISKRLVELMGGELGVTSQMGQGSTFWFSLPFRRVATATTIALPQWQNLRALVLVHGPTLREVVTQSLLAWGLRVAEVASLDEVPAEVERTLGTAEEPRLILVEAAEGTDAQVLELPRRVRELSRISEVRFLLVGMGDRSSLEPQVLEAGYAAALARPLHQSHLFDSLSDLVAWERPASPMEHEPREAPSFGHARVLLVEDNAVNQKVATMQLERLGLSPVVVGDGAAALDMLAAQAFDLVLMDCQMPVMDGFETTERVREREGASGRHTPIVAMTANAMKGDRERCLAAGMDDYLSKPFTRVQLHEVLGRYLAPKSPAAPPPMDTHRLADFMSPSEIKEMLVLFAGGLDGALGKLGLAHQQGDLPVFKAELHDLKGTAANMGADALSAACRELELMLREGVLGELDALEREISRVVQYVAAQ